MTRQARDNRAPEETFEPYEEHRGIPLPVLWIAIALALWGVVMLFQSHSAADSGITRRASQLSTQTGQTADAGAALFVANCSTCHQPEGTGISAAIPPLAGSPFTAARPEVVTQILLHGINGPIRVGDRDFNGHMPSFASVLSNEEIARIGNYVRKRFGGQPPELTPQLVARERERFADRGPWAGGAEIAGTVDASLAPQPPTVPARIVPTDAATRHLVNDGRGDAWACASCHGAQGQGNEDVPRLAGLPAAYIAKQLGDFSSGRRDNDSMRVVARALSKREMAALGRYYERLSVPSTARPSLGGDLARGEKLALEGDWENKVPACFSCHGPSGFGVAPTFPSLSAQHPSYTARQLADWAGGVRSNSPVQMMEKISGRLSAEDRRAIADYLATLPPVPARKPTPEEASNANTAR
ncbi:c-type cytochrome [Stakelama marina]|uniref:C-type cytochrome n=1 Tax=Stakelama marina TaxID=2826939 RepID=A0A8T4IHP0_9SPHN|nr:c-type cytochrome [Stakelama marina]MBR0552595.1 c-type cytochrome [Stakelama marina]